MPDGSLVKTGGAWTGVGVHPTPSKLVRGFARAVAAAVLRRRESGAVVTVLDACAGDGRLGHAVAKRLSRLGYRPKLTLVEADVQRVSKRQSSYEVEQVIGNFYTFASSKKFDVVVSNPPYLALSRREAKRLELDWSHVLNCGRNLYGLALSKCLSVCVSDGVAALIAPHGWLRNWYGSGLRAQVNGAVERVDIYASSSRRLFPGVNQDVAAQIFELRKDVTGDVPAAVRISYDLAEFDDVALPARSANRKQVSARVRVGPFVWNREKELLSARAVGLRVVYGGNISRSGDLNFDVSRYRGRQFVAKTRVPGSYISTGPCLLIKRSLRGVPGDWKLDAAFINSSVGFVAENHVIVVEFSSNISVIAIQSVCSHIIRSVENDHRHHGHPNVSVAIVRQRVLSSQEAATNNERLSKR